MVRGPQWTDCGSSPESVTPLAASIFTLKVPDVLCSCGGPGTVAELMVRVFVFFFSLRYCCVQTTSRVYPDSYSVYTGGSFPSRSVKLTTHLYLVPRSRMRRAISPLPYTSTGTTLPLVKRECKSRDSSFSIALGCGLDDRGSRVRFPAGMGIFLFTTASRTALGPTQSPIHWIPGTLSLRLKRPGREADHSPPSNAEVKE
jgi:hypothetical protein